VEAAEIKVPRSAGWLGGLGAVPFIGLAGAMPFLNGAPRLLVAHALVAYGATILSFLGGVHWGLAIGSQRSEDDGKLGARLTLSVFPSLAGWAALLVALQSSVTAFLTAWTSGQWSGFPRVAADGGKSRTTCATSGV
jgi:Protein of unknown function (DUF3429)